MDVEFLAARINSVRPNSLDNSDNVVAVVEEDGRAWFPCSFCYVEIEVQILCKHLQEEHCFDFKNAVCPICAATLGKDPLGHFMLQHAQSVKRSRKYRKPGFWSNSAAVSGKDSNEINLFFSTNLVVGRHNGGQEPAADPLLLQFLCNVTHSDPKDGLQDKSPSSVAATSAVESRKVTFCDPSLEEQYDEEKRQRAAFLQELVASTIF